MAWPKLGQAQSQTSWIYELTCVWIDPMTREYELTWLFTNAAACEYEFTWICVICLHPVYDPSARHQTYFVDISTWGQSNTCLVAGHCLGILLNILFSIILNIVENVFFALYGTWGPLGVGKILAQGVGTICPPGEYHSGRKQVWTCCMLSERCQVAGIYW